MDHAKRIELAELIGAVLASSRATGRAVAELSDRHVEYLERALAIVVEAEA